MQYHDQKRKCMPARVICNAEANRAVTQDSSKSLVKGLIDGAGAGAGWTVKLQNAML